MPSIAQKLLTKDAKRSDDEKNKNSGIQTLPSLKTGKDRRGAGKVMHMSH